MQAKSNAGGGAASAPAIVRCKTPGCRSFTAEGFCVPCQEGEPAPLLSLEGGAGTLASSGASLAASPLASHQSEGKQGKGYYLDQNQDGDEDGDQDQDNSPPSSRDGVEGLGLGSRTIEEFAELRAAYEAGTLEPIAVELGPIPAHFGPIQRAIAEDMRLLMGLRLAEGESRPLPYPSSAPKAIGLASDKIQASRILRRLVNARVVDEAPSLKQFKRGDWVLDGTKCYAPPAGEAK